MNAKLILLVLGVIIGGVAGWLTAPPPVASMSVGPVKVQVEGDQSGGTMTATDNQGGGMQVSVGNGGMLGDRTERTAIFAVIGGLIGLVIGVVADRRRTV